MYEDYDYAEQIDNDEPITVECEVTLTITRKVKLKVYDFQCYEDTDYNDNYTRELDFSDTDWDEVIEDNNIVPKKWSLVDSNVTVLQ